MRLPAIHLAERQNDWTTIPVRCDSTAGRLLIALFTQAEQLRIP